MSRAARGEAALGSTPSGRALRMAAMSAGVAGSYVGYLVQSAFLDKTRRRAKLTAAHQRAGRRLRDELMSLRGPAMKLGQALSLQEGILPDAAVAELASLQMQAPGMHASLVRAQFHGSLGRFPEDVFAEFDPEPFAAASLGQVHRATTRDGRRVAVKIQYPGIRDAVAHDFTWFRTVSKPAQISGHFPKAVIDELEAGILAETDYSQEARNLKHFREGLKPLPFVHLPEVLPDYSSDRVLTMSIIGGRHLAEFMAQRPSQKIRDLIGARLFELFYFQLLRLHALHADPHWGNYLFGHDGSIGLVDFGCVKYMNPRYVETLQSLFLFDGSPDSPEFQRRLQQRYDAMGAKLLPATRRALMLFSVNFYRRVYPPERRDPTPFDFADASFLNWYLKASEILVKAKGIEPEYIFMGRAEAGLYHTLHKLKARVPTSQILRRLL